MIIHSANIDKNDTYLKEERQGQIRAMVEEQGRVIVPELSAYFSVSEATIRRDLEELDSQGLIRRTHGGAVRVDKAPKEPPILNRMGDQQDEKTRIGKAAVELIKDGETVFLGSGTTVIQVAQNLPTDIHLTVITNSLPVVNELATHPGIELIVIGGMLRQSELSMVGHVAEQSVREFRADRVILGMYAIDVSCGFTNDYPPEIMTDRAIIDISPQLIVLADHSKFSRVSSMLVAPVTAAQVIITDQATPQTIIDELREKGIRVIQA
ncbi:MAG: DeoR/GlpR family DNA-binding transcription regulator [Chloroflexota bacterium]|nr:DeoR/GlpR family DNA-binding transcription regulator [Chloroflexota bacterium]